MGKDLKGKELGTGIIQLKDGRYKARFTNRFGKRMPPIYSWNLKEVRELLNKAKYEDSLGKDGVIHKNITVEEMYQQYLKEKAEDIRETTLYNHKIQYENHISQYKYYQITNINDKFVKDFMASLIAKKLTMGTLINIKAVFSGIMDCAVDRKICLYNPFTGYKFPKSVKDKAKKRAEQLKRTKFLTEEQRKIFFDYVDNARQCYLRPLYRLMLYTGIRIGEAIALKWEHVDLDKKLIFIQDGYSEYWEDEVAHITYNGLTKSPTSTRQMPLSTAAVELLKQEKEKANGRTTGLIFFNSRGEPLRHSQVLGCLESLIKTINKKYPDANLPKITPHYFRHTFATMCLENDVNIKAVQYYLGHAQLSTTADLYSHVTNDWTIKEIQKMN